MSFERFSEPPELDLWEGRHRVPFLGWILIGFCLAPFTVAPFFMGTASDFAGLALIFMITGVLAPYAVLTVFVGAMSPSIPVAIALIQFPVYGLMIGIAQRRGTKSRNTVIGWLLVFHVMAFGVAVLLAIFHLKLPWFG